MKRAIDGAIDYGKVQKLATGTIGEGDVQAAVAALHFLLMGAARHDVEEGILAKELEQLGVPKEHSDAVCKPYAKDKEALRSKLMDTTLSVDKLRNLLWDINVAETAEGRGGGEGGEAGGGASGGGGDVAVSVAIEMETERLGKVEFDCPEGKFRILLHELKAARARLDA